MKCNGSCVRLDWETGHSLRVTILTRPPGFHSGARHTDIWYQCHGQYDRSHYYLDPPLSLYAFCFTLYCRRRRIVEEDGVVSLLALLRNEMAAVQEGALQVMANLAQGDDDDARIRLLVSAKGQAHTQVVHTYHMEHSKDGREAGSALWLLRLVSPPEQQVCLCHECDVVQRRLYSLA